MLCDQHSTDITGRFISASPVHDITASAIIEFPKDQVKPAEEREQKNRNDGGPSGDFLHHDRQPRRHHCAR